MMDNSETNAVSEISKRTPIPRKERFKIYKFTCDCVVRYLTDGDISGLSQNQIRKVKYQAERHIFNSKRKYMILSLVLNMQV